MASRLKQKTTAKAPKTALAKLVQEINAATLNTIAHEENSRRLSLGTLRRDEFGMVCRRAARD